MSTHLLMFYQYVQKRMDLRERMGNLDKRKDRYFWYTDPDFCVIQTQKIRPHPKTGTDDINLSS